MPRAPPDRGSPALLAALGIGAALCAGAAPVPAPVSAPVAASGRGPAPADRNADLDALMKAWSGLRDSSETVTVGAGPLPEDERQRRVSTTVAPVHLPWLGEHVLYLEETAYDEPDVPRRQLLLQLEAAEAAVIRVRLYTFADPPRWAQLDRRPQLAAHLQAADVRSFPGCDLVFTRLSTQPGSPFRGSTRGRQCLASPDSAAVAGPQLPGHGGREPRYVDYQLLVDENVYWYRRRITRFSDGEIVGEVVGFNWFELNEARLFSCRIDWSGTGHPRDLQPLTHMDLHDKGGRGAFVTPDGRHLLLTLHSQDWPYAAEHDSLVLLLSEAGAPAPLAASWAVVDDTGITLHLPWLGVRCGAIAPRPDEVRG